MADEEKSQAKYDIIQMLHEKNQHWVCYECPVCKCLNVTVVNSGRTFCDDCDSVLAVDQSTDNPTLSILSVLG